MKIREAKKSDIQPIINIGNYAKEFEVSDGVVNFWPEKILSQIIESKNDFIIVAEKDKNILGFIIVNLNVNFSKAIIENIFVKENFRGNNVGRLLLDHTLNKLSKKKCSYVCALVNSESKSSINWYIKNEFSKGIKCVWLDKILLKSFLKGMIDKK